MFGSLMLDETLGKIRSKGQYGCSMLTSGVMLTVGLFLCPAKYS